MTGIAEFQERIAGLMAELPAERRGLVTDPQRQQGMLGRLAKVLEASHQVAVRTLADLVADEHPDIAAELRTALGEVDADAEQYSAPEFGFTLYWLHEAPDRIVAAAPGAAEIPLVIDLLRRTLPAAFITADQTARLFAATAARPLRPVWIAADGTVYGTAQYEQLDIGWTRALTNLVSTLWNDAFVEPFPTRKDIMPVPLEANAQGGVRIAVLGDWGGGNALARGVMETLASLDPDYVIHLGDVYYAGTDSKGSPPGEEQDFLVDFWRRYGPAKDGRCFTLNSNHEMYSGARGYFDVALADPMFSGQGRYSYFALAFGGWVIAGFDSAYYASSLTFFLRGDLGGGEDPQYDFLKEVASWGKKTILMSHHNPISYKGKKSGGFWRRHSFWDEVTRVITPDYWYWGHLHLGAVYNGSSAAGAVKARCVGHGCIPFGVPRGLEGAACVDWFSDTALDDPDERAYPGGAQRAVNGFAMITLTEDGIAEEFFHAGSTTPVYRIPTAG